MVLKKFQELQTYQKKLKELLHNGIVDIILFGSSVKGGIPNDIDIALIADKKVDMTPLRKEISSIVGREADVEILSVDSIYSPLWITLIKEGFSIKKNCFISEIYKVKPVALYKYSLKKLNNTQKVQFERAIKNILGKEGVFLTRSVVLIPISIKNEMIDVLKKWNIYYECMEYELLPIVRKEMFI